MIRYICSYSLLSAYDEVHLLIMFVECKMIRYICSYSLLSAYDEVHLLIMFAECKC